MSILFIALFTACSRAHTKWRGAYRWQSAVYATYIPPGRPSQGLPLPSITPPTNTTTRRQARIYRPHWTSLSSEEHVKILNHHNHSHWRRSALNYIQHHAFNYIQHHAFNCIQHHAFNYIQHHACVCCGTLYTYVYMVWYEPRP